MASLIKPKKCIKSNCFGQNFKKLKNPERWICTTCNEVVIQRAMKNPKNKCYKCNVKRGKVEFRNNKNICKPCYSVQQKQWREDNSVTLKEKRKIYFKNLDPKIRWKRVKKSVERCSESFLADQMYHIKSRSNNPEYSKNSSCPTKREFDLNREYLNELWEKQEGKCAITKISMVHKFGFLESASIDRIDSSKGHVKGNIQIVCLGINRLKNSHSNEEVSQFLKRIQNEIC